MCKKRPNRITSRKRPIGPYKIQKATDDGLQKPLGRQLIQYWVHGNTNIFPPLVFANGISLSLSREMWYLAILCIIGWNGPLWILKFFIRYNQILARCWMLLGGIEFPSLPSLPFPSPPFPYLPLPSLPSHWAGNIAMSLSLSLSRSLSRDRQGLVLYYFNK